VGDAVKQLVMVDTAGAASNVVHIHFVVTPGLVLHLFRGSR
jgi:hypothetical protein